MPKIISPNDDPAIFTMHGAHHYRFAGIEVSIDDANNNLVLMGWGLENASDPIYTKTPASTLAEMPHDITFDPFVFFTPPTMRTRAA